MKNEVHKCFKAQHLEHKAAKQTLLDECTLSKSSHAAMVAHKEVLEAQLMSKHEEAERSAEDHESYVRGLREQHAAELEAVHSNHRGEVERIEEAHERALATISEKNKTRRDQVHDDHRMHCSALEEKLKSMNEEKIAFESRDLNLVAELSRSELKVTQLTSQVAQLTADLASAAVAEWETLRAAAVAVAGPAPAPTRQPKEQAIRADHGDTGSSPSRPAAAPKAQGPILL